MKAVTVAFLRPLITGPNLLSFMYTFRVTEALCMFESFKNLEAIDIDLVCNVWLITWYSYTLLIVLELFEKKLDNPI